MVRDAPAQLKPNNLNTRSSVFSGTTFSSHDWAAVWKGAVVGDGSVYLAINQLRQALEESAYGVRYIETIPRRGYRLTVPVEPLEPVGESEATAPPRAQPGRIGRKSWRWAAAALPWSSRDPGRDRQVRRQGVADQARCGRHRPRAGHDTQRRGIRGISARHRAQSYRASTHPPSRICSVPLRSIRRSRSPGRG